ncbi:hypothetical protein BC629DRAFT_1438262 [Irpex lacteus]|nr:hypothetical protein BC629DRAFT_1438262 [Irpex lacteus]
MQQHCTPLQLGSSLAYNNVSYFPSEFEIDLLYTDAKRKRKAAFTMLSTGVGGYAELYHQGRCIGFKARSYNTPEVLVQCTRVRRKISTTGKVEKRARTRDMFVVLFDARDYKTILPYLWFWAYWICDSKYTVAAKSPATSIYGRSFRSEGGLRDWPEIYCPHFVNHYLLVKIRERDTLELLGQAQENKTSSLRP